jgi:hypothetical protein
MAYIDFHPETLNESGKFLIKNLIDLLKLQSGDYFKDYEDKFNRVVEEFLRYYELKEPQLIAISKAIQERIANPKQIDPIDLPSYEDTFRQMDRGYNGVGELLRYKEDLAKQGKSSRDELLLFYLIIIKLRAVNLDSPRNWATKYFLPCLIDHKYVCWIVFDEKAVHKVVALCSLNQYDIYSPLYAKPLKVNCRIFKK